MSKIFYFCLFFWFLLFILYLITGGNMSNNQITRPSSAVYNRGNARARLTIKILIYVLSVFLVGTILSYFVFYNKQDTDGIAGTPINRSSFGEVTSRGRYDSWNASTYTAPTSGSGTESSPYIISSAAQFMYLSKVTSGSSYYGKYWRLTTDLDLTSHRANFNGFSGYIDGNSHTIKINLNHGSLFGTTTGVMEVHDLTIDTTGNYNSSVSESTNIGILFDQYTGESLAPNFYDIHICGDGMITVDLASSGTYFVSVGSLIGENGGGIIAEIFVEGITINVIANGSSSSGSNGDDNTNQGYYYFGGIVGHMNDTYTDNSGNARAGAIDTALWTGTITFGGYMAGNTSDGREIAIGGITGYGSPSASISQGTIAYDYHGNNSHGDNSLIGGITGIPAIYEDLAETRDLINNCTMEINSRYTPSFTAYTKEVVNKDRLQYISNGSIISTSNITLTNTNSSPLFTTDANMKVHATYGDFTDTIFGDGATGVMILDSSVNDGYPWMVRWSSYTPTPSTPTTNFDPTANGMTGSGAENDPFIITTQAQFLIMANYYNENNAKKGYYWKISPYNATTPAQITFDLGNNWRPIGYDQAHAFTGILNGGGVVITGLGITSNYTYVGLFGYVSAGAKISNLGISATTGNTSNITYDYDQASYIGGMVGYLAKGAYMENCYFIGKLTGYLNSSASRTVGGLAGYYDNAVSNSSVTPAIKTSYYIADHKIYFKSGSTTNTKSEHMEKIYGTGSTTTSSGILDGKSFTAQSTFTPYGFSFGNLTAVSGSTGNYEWTSAYAGKWHTTAGLYNGYPYLDASDGMYFKISRANVTGGTFTGTYKIGTESKGSLVFTSGSKLSQNLPVRAVFSYNYTKSAIHDTILNLSLNVNTKTLFNHAKAFNTSATSVSESNLALTNNYKVTGESLIVKDTNYAKHTLTVTNNNADLGSFSRTNSNSLVTETSITNGYKYVGRNNGSTGVNLKFTANSAVNSTYYYIDSITVGGSTLYSVSAPTTIKTVANCSASITAKLGDAGTATNYATTITLNFSLPNNTNTTAVVVKFGKVLTAKQGIRFNTDSGEDRTSEKANTTLTIVAGTQVTDPNTSNKLPTRSEGIGGTFIGWIDKKADGSVGKLISTDDELNYIAESDTASIEEFWSDIANSVRFTTQSGHNYSLLHKKTNISVTFNTTITNMMVGEWLVTDLTTGKSTTITIRTATTSINLTSQPWA